MTGTSLNIPYYQILVFIKTLNTNRGKGNRLTQVLVWSI